MKANHFAWLLFLALFLGGCNKQSSTSAPSTDIAALRAKAMGGDAEAQLKVAGAYFNGDGVAKDYVESIKWFRKAAEQNNAKAQYNLAAFYANGLGVAKDEVEATKWVRKSAELNNAFAQCTLECV